jgi:hypothetical protein
MERDRGAGTRIATGLLAALLVGASLVASAAADPTGASPAALSYASPLALSHHSVSIRVRCRHSTGCAGHVVLQLFGTDGSDAGRAVDTESRSVTLAPGRSRLIVLRYSARAQELLRTGHRLSVRVTLRRA